jgi:hypothetical protein
MAKSSNTPKQEVKFEISPVTFSEEVTSASTIETVIIPAPVVEEVPVKPSINKEEIVIKLGELATIFRNLYGEQLNPVFAEIHKSLSNAQYKIMQNL